MILIVSSYQDDHARAVLAALERQTDRVGLLDLSDFPQWLQLSMDFEGSASPTHTLIDDLHNELELVECNVIWWRRPQQYALHPEIQTDVDYRFAYSECHAALSGLWSSLDAYWINNPIRDEEAHRKVYQLKVAQEVGFEIPTTRITNHPEKAQEFIDRFGPESTVYKPFTATLQAWRETRIVRPDEVSLIDSVRFSPVIFQEYVPARVDLRITVMGDDIFPAAIHSQETEYVVDYRMVMDQTRMEPFDLPDEIIERIREYMERLGLVYGAIDMRITPDDRYVFLEINPSGQWIFIEERTGLPLTETFARLLQSRDKTRSDPEGEKE